MTTLRKLRRSIRPVKKAVKKTSPKSGSAREGSPATEESGSWKKLGFWVKISAIVVGVCAVVGAAIGIVQALRQPATTENRVESHNHSGGVTAQTYNDNSVKQYFDDIQPPDKKQQWRDYLTKQYPLGWAIIAADGNTVYTPAGFSYQEGFEVRWGVERVSRLTAEYVYITSPDIFVKDHGPLMGGNQFDLHRKVGDTERILWIGEKAVVAEVLEDQGNFVVIAIGFRLESRTAAKTATE